MIDQYRYQVGQFSIGLFSFKLQGADVQEFLQNQSAYDIDKIQTGEFHLVSFTDIRGQIETYGWLLKFSTHYLYLVPELLKDISEERLNRYLISEDVTIGAPVWEDWNFILGTRAPEYKTENSLSGEMFGDSAILLFNESLSEVPVIEEESVDLWRDLSGWPSLKGDDFKKELITNSELFDLAVSMNKGCYPGQETVSKITTRRGAAYAPVLIKVSQNPGVGELINFDKKIGEVSKVVKWKGEIYLSAKLLRDFRVQGLQVSFTLNGIALQGTVFYYPLIQGTPSEKAKELFYEASDFFLKDNLESAEECFKLSLIQDPTFADSLEALGVLLGRVGRFEEAIAYMKRLAQVDQTSVLAHTNMSLYLMKLGKIEEAEEQKSQATLKSFAKFGEEAKQKRNDSEAQQKRLSEWEQREGMFRQVLEIDSEDTLANFGLGSIAVERGDWENAVGYLTKVLEFDKAYSVAYLALGRALKALKKKDDARKIFQEGIKVAAAKGDLMPANQMQSELDQL
jgi:folate-binding protein YgfZ